MTVTAAGEDMLMEGNRRSFVTCRCIDQTESSGRELKFARGCGDIDIFHCCVLHFGVGSLTVLSRFRPRAR